MSFQRGIPLKKCVVSIVVLILLLSSSLLGAASVSQEGTNEGSNRDVKNTIYVDDSNTQGPWDGSYEHPYQTIYDGTLHAADSDIVFVFSGLYEESVLLDKSIFLEGETQNSTIIDGQNNGSTITITHDQASINSFTVRNSGGYQGDAGITVVADFITITKCTVYRSHTGILLQDVGNVVIDSCEFHTNGYGIRSLSSSFVTLDRCTFYHNGIGAYFSGTNVITIEHTYADTNGIGFFCERSTDIRISESAARDNDDNEGGMFFQHCTGIVLTDSHLVHNGVGVSLINSTEWNISQCNFSLNTHFACKIKNSTSRFDLRNCLFAYNYRYGLYAENSVFTVSFCNIYMNQNYGLYAKSSTIDARYNWWESLRGPAHTGLIRADRCTWAPGKIKVVPWRSSPLAHSRPTWDLESTFQKPSTTTPWPEQITFTDPDADYDQVPDWWEIQWGYNPAAWDDHQHLDPDKDSLNNIEECYMANAGSSPFKKDVFLELDWTESLIPGASNKPSVDEVTRMVEAFARPNITLHVDTGELGGGEQIPATPHVSYADIVTLYWEYFLHDDMNNPRQRIFRYGIICDYTEGTGFAVMGWDHLNSFIIGAQVLVDKFPGYKREVMVMTSVMHEVGHTFGLIVTKYNGIDNHLAMKPSYKAFWVYSRYKSILNYAYTFSMMDFSDGSHGPGDYDDWGNLDFSFFKNTSFEYPLS
jgi:nitrous oxidase accessory protein NosD